MEEPFIVTQLAPEALDVPDTATLLADLDREIGATPSGDDLVIVEEPPPPLGRSWAFDFNGGGFVRGASKGPLATHGTATLLGWVEKCLMTARDAHPIHPPGYGMEEPFYAIGRNLGDDETLGDRIRDALTFHERIADIRDVIVESDPNDEYLEVSFTVILDDSTVLPLTNVRIG